MPKKPISKRRVLLAEKLVEAPTTVGALFAPELETRDWSYLSNCKVYQYNNKNFTKDLLGKFQDMMDASLEPKAKVSVMWESA